MLSFLKKIYRRKQEKEVYLKFCQLATISEMFETGLNADIFNESGDPNKIVIGHHTRILGTLQCKKNATIKIGNYSVIQDRVALQCLEQINIGSYVAVASGTVICDNNNHSIDPVEWIKHRLRTSPGGK